MNQLYIKQKAICNIRNLTEAVSFNDTTGAGSIETIESKDFLKIINGVSTFFNIKNYKNINDNGTETYFTFKAEFLDAGGFIDITNGYNGTNITESGIYDSRDFTESYILHMSFKGGINCLISDIIEYTNIYTLIEVNDDIKITSSLKDIKSPESKNNSYSKTFKIPATKETNDIFFGLVNDLIVYEEGLWDIKYETIIYSNGFQVNTGTILVNKLIEDKNKDLFYEVFFIGNKNTFFEELEIVNLYMIDTDTFENQTALNIFNNISELTSGEYAKANNIKHTYALMEMGENLSDLQTKPALTQDSNSSVKGKVGLMADSFTPVFWNHYVFTKLHEYLGYTVSGDILDDPNFLNLVHPAIRKNWWEDDEEFDIKKIIFDGWYPDNSMLQTQTYYYSTNGSGGELNMFNPLESTNQVTDGLFKTDGTSTKYSRYVNSYGLGTVRQIIDWSNLSLNVFKSIDPDYYTPHPTMRIKLYASQQYGDHTTTNFEPVLLQTQDIEMSTNTVIKFNQNGECDKNLYFSYKNSNSSLTYFYITYEYINDYSGEDDSNFYLRFTLNISAGGIGTKQNTTNDEYYTKFDRFIGQQVGVFQLDKEKTGKEYIEDMIKMFNLVVEIDGKNINYDKYYNFLNSTIIDLTDYFIENTKKEKVYKKNIIDLYKFKFNYDENDLLTKKYLSDYNDKNPTEFIKKYDRGNIPTEIYINSDYYFNTGLTIDTHNTEVLCNIAEENKINYKWNKNFYSFIWFDNTQGNINLPINSINLVNTYQLEQYPLLSNIYSNVGMSFRNTETYIGSESTSNLYLDYYKDISDRISSTQSYLYTAYFYIPAHVYNSIELSKKIRIKDKLYYINKIFDWCSDNKTKIELIKIYDKSTYF